MAEEAQQLLLNQFKDAVNGLTTRAVTDDGNEIFTLRHPLVHRVAVTLLQVLQHGLIDSFWSSHAKLFWDCISEIEKTYYAAFDTFERAKNSAAGQKSANGKAIMFVLFSLEEQVLGTYLDKWLELSIIKEYYQPWAFVRNEEANLLLLPLVESLKMVEIQPLEDGGGDVDDAGAFGEGDDPSLITAAGAHAAATSPGGSAGGIINSAAGAGSPDEDGNGGRSRSASAAAGAVADGVREGLATEPTPESANRSRASTVDYSTPQPGLSGLPVGAPPVGGFVPAAVVAAPVAGKGAGGRGKGKGKRKRKRKAAVDIGIIDPSAQQGLPELDDLKRRSRANTPDSMEHAAQADGGDVGDSDAKDEEEEEEAEKAKAATLFFARNFVLDSCTVDGGNADERVRLADLRTAFDAYIASNGLAGANAGDLSDAVVGALCEEFSLAWAPGDEFIVGMSTRLPVSNGADGDGTPAETAGAAGSGANGGEGGNGDGDGEAENAAGLDDEHSPDQTEAAATVGAQAVVEASDRGTVSAVAVARDPIAVTAIEVDAPGARLDAAESELGAARVLSVGPAVECFEAEIQTDVAWEDLIPPELPPAPDVYDGWAQTEANEVFEVAVQTERRGPDQAFVESLLEPKAGTLSAALAGVDRALAAGRAGSDADGGGSTGTASSFAMSALGLPGASSAGSTLSYSIASMTNKLQLGAGGRSDGPATSNGNEGGEGGGGGGGGGEDILHFAIHDFEGDGEGQIAFRTGDLIKVINTNRSGWWKGRANGVTGLFPSNFTSPAGSAMDGVPLPLTPEEAAIARAAEEAAAAEAAALAAAEAAAAAAASSSAAGSSASAMDGTGSGELRFRTADEVFAADPRLASTYMALRDGVEVSDRKSLFSSYIQCFVGSEAVTWLLENYGMETADEACTVMQRMMEDGLVGNASGKGAFQNKNAFFTFVTPPWELQELEAVAAAMRSDDALDVADRKYRGFTYKQCFLGSEAVTWLREYLLQSGQGDTSAAAAVGLGQRLLQAGFIAHVTKKHSFKDEELFYVFGQP